MAYWNIKSSSHLMLLTIALIVMTIAMAFLAGSSNNFLKHDAYLINSSGLIRGSIQRLVKLHAFQQYEKQDEIIQFIDTRFDSINKLYELESASPGREHITQKIRELNLTWSYIKNLLIDPTQEQNPNNNESLLKLSEIAWKMADDIASLTQTAAEAKTAQFKYFYWVTFLIVLINLLSLVIIYYSVRVRLERMATTDNLTLVANRHTFMHRFHTEHTRALRYHNPTSLIMIDIDHFKLINDRHGHLMGDSVLKTVSGIMQANLRNNDLLGRIGGEEFAILVAQTDLSGALSLAEKIRTAIEAHTFEITEPVTISVGVAVFEEGMTAAQWLDNADKELYKAKYNGRNTVMPKVKNPRKVKTPS